MWRYWWHAGNRAVGQFWSDGYTDPDLLTIEASGGRLPTRAFHRINRIIFLEMRRSFWRNDGGLCRTYDNSSLDIFGDDAKTDGDEGRTGDAVAGR
jgi:hypothetical protein